MLVNNGGILVEKEEVGEGIGKNKFMKNSWLIYGQFMSIREYVFFEHEYS